MKEIIITRDNAGGRLDKILTNYLNKAPKSFIYKMLRKKNIVLNDKKAAGNEIIKEGDSIKLYLADDTIAKFQGKSPIVTKKAPDIPIVFEDDNILILDKPAGLLSQKSNPSDISVNDFLLQYLKSDDPLFKPGISNRLDRNTSGLVLAGKNLYATRMLNDAIKNRRLQKKYLCLVKGIVEKEALIDGYLLKDEKTNQVSVQKAATNEEAEKKDSLKEKSAEKASRILTSYLPLEKYSDATLLEVDLITGKSHQIRAHLASIGHPIIGDPKYGDAQVNAAYKRKYHVNRQLLHAYKIIFRTMEGDLSYLNGSSVTGMLPEDFQNVISQKSEC